MNAIERLLRYVPRENHEHHCSYFWGEGEDECDCGLEERRSDAAAVDALYQAARERLVKGHADTCSYELDDEQHSNGYVCDCGHAALAAVVRRVEAGA